MQRRHFLNRLPIITSIPLLFRQGFDTQIRGLSDVIHELESLDPKKEAYWQKVRQAYDIPDGRIDFNNAGIGTPCLTVLNSLVDENRQFGQLPSKQNNQIRRILQACTDSLSKLTKCHVDEIAICRNASEALAISIFGIPLKPGDEVVLGKYDYPHIYYAWKQRELRDGIILKFVDIGKSPKNPKSITRKYLKAVGPKTKAIQITDLVNYNGCVIPTKKIIDKLPDHVRYRIVDAAQSFANTTDVLSDYGATHLGVSLHKWLGAPVGTGLLYVQRDYIEETWPLFASISAKESKIDKFVHFGTLNTAVFPGILMAVEFHNAIGLENKLARLTELSDYFIEKLHSLKNFEVVSPRHEKLKSNLILFKHQNKPNQTIHSTLWQNHKIHVTSMDWFDVYGIRISPNIFTSYADVNALIEALSEID